MTNGQPLGCGQTRDSSEGDPSHRTSYDSIFGLMTPLVSEPPLIEEHIIAHTSGPLVFDEKKSVAPPPKVGSPEWQSSWTIQIHNVTHIHAQLLFQL